MKCVSFFERVVTKKNVVETIIQLTIWSSSPSTPLKENTYRRSNGQQLGNRVFYSHAYLCLYIHSNARISLRLETDCLESRLSSSMEFKSGFLGSYSITFKDYSASNCFKYTLHCLDVRFGWLSCWNTQFRLSILVSEGTTLFSRICRCCYFFNMYSIFTISPTIVVINQFRAIIETIHFSFVCSKKKHSFVNRKSRILFSWL